MIILIQSGDRTCHAWYTDTVLDYLIAVLYSQVGSNLHVILKVFIVFFNLSFWENNFFTFYQSKFS